MADAWDRQKSESSKSYERFLIYLRLPPEQRSYQKVRDKLVEIGENTGQNNKIPTVSAIESSASTWKWRDRAKLHDLHNNMEEMLANDTAFKKENVEWQNTWKEVLNFANEVLSRIMNNFNGYKLTTQVNMFSSLVNLLDKAYSNFRLSHGRSTKINETTVEAEVSAAVEAEVENTNIVNIGDKELEELLTINDVQEEFTDEL